MSTNNLRYLRPAGQAGRPLGVSGGQWLSWLAPQRSSYIESQNRPRAGEGAAAYASRINQIVAQVTTDALKNRVRAAGQADADGGKTVTNNIGTDTADKPADTLPGRTGMSDAQVHDISTSVAGILGTTALLIQHAIESGDATERARIAADADVRIRTLQQQVASSADPATSSVAESQIAELTELRRRLNGGMSTNTMLMIGGGVLLVGALAFFALRRPARNNPVIYKRIKKLRDKSARGKLRPHHFIKASKLR